ncbi:carboxypeptidase regulatory-like domain-containing protein [Roseisolibacter sp. H3M3-2]|uniref:carboxypeptidase regulatory-like domain-containing protein n=1 Tax=Roseisolibacter sp. H3M3-2 TaxID=3031323 RepID=UPI0023D9A019|nr:carboxypeptidase regulatory-like domain-containing protein [Roseisolibacter sp. H3M3-2]MDF1504530.1 carboxypeptidase regulatory-like domain-containing protein [Roseisolibacter sp. H3M3-2]
MRTAPFGAVCALLVLLPGAARAQQAVLRGRVLAGDSAGGRPVPDAEVAIPALGRTARADSAGAFVFDRLPVGELELQVRRLGFEPATRRVAIEGAAETVSLVVRLSARVQSLTPVNVRDSAARPAVILTRRHERERAAAHGGTFLDDTLLARSENTVMSTLLRRVPGTSLIRYQAGGRSYMALGSRRGGMTFQAKNPNCFYQVYVDGVQMFVPSARNDDPPPDIDQFRPVDLEGVEIYRGSARTPTQYVGTGAACGTVLFWSRRGR